MRHSAAIVVLGFLGVGIGAPARAQVDDHPGDCGAASPVAAGGGEVGEVARLNGSLETAGDVDWFELQLRARHLYRFNPWTLACGICPRARAVGVDCVSEIARVEPFESPKVYWFLAPADGRVRVAVDSPRGALGGYSVPIDLIGGPYIDDHASTAAGAETVTPGAGEIAGVLEFGQDADVFVFAGRAGAMYRVEVLEGLTAPGGAGGATDLTVRLGPLGPAGEVVGGAEIPSGDCLRRPEGCAATRLVATASAPIYVTVEHREYRREDLPALGYRLRLVDEGDFVATAGAAECGAAPAVAPGGTIGVVLPDEAFAVRSWTIQTRAGHIYRTRLEATAGAGAMDLALGVLDGECQGTFAYSEPLRDPLTTYFRAMETGAARLFVQRTRVRVDALGAPLAGRCVVGLEDLGPVVDREPDTPDLALGFNIGGRIEAGSIDYGGDRDWFLGFMPERVMFRVEARVCSEGPAAAAGVVLWAFAGPSTASVAVSRGVGGGEGWSGRALSTPTGAPVFVLVEPAPGPRPEEGVCYEFRVVRVECRGDWDGSGERDLRDVFAYLADYFGGRGEFDGAGGRGGVEDLLGFLGAWFGACP